MNFLFEMAPLWLTLLIVFVIVLMFVLALKAKNAELEDKRSWFKKQSDLSFNDLRICRANAENLSKRLEDRKFELDGKKRLVSNLKASLAENKVYIDKVEKDLADAISEHDVIVSYNNTHIEELEEKKKNNFRTQQNHWKAERGDCCSIKEEQVFAESDQWDVLFYTRKL